ncbi:uncharacterized protein [Physcomitrium patens]|uniref:uncharacterized protein isoform X2 n=1 Tax=Physcomitrium patens TaxID=3218 RepID=UPI00024B0777|nr:uncharacterized protein LOC112284125 isoform X2 [Physcomitrium patens]|eukprot:XP_024379473.1 uncharacterized protein LOC112284125 isoform X2 [Physcomitrella patens]
MKALVDLKNYNLFIFRRSDRCTVISPCRRSTFTSFFDFADHRSLRWEELCLCVPPHAISAPASLYDISFFFSGSPCCEVAHTRCIGIRGALSSVILLMATKLIEATSLTWSAASTSTACSRKQKVLEIGRVRIYQSLSTGIKTLKSGPKPAKGCIRMASSKVFDTDVGVEKWTMPDSKPLGHETVVQVTPRDVWFWQADTHWKTWHGLWINYQPQKTKELTKEYKSVRSLQKVDPERLKYYQRNQWYDAKGFGKDIKWAYGPWHFNIEEHLLNDGILHPCSKDHRTLLFPSGNLGWIQMYLKPNDPNSVIFSEPMFYVNPNQRISVPVGYDSEGMLGTALLLEEVHDTEERFDSTWSGTFWKHCRDPLEETREEPKGVYRGHEESITPGMEWMMREAEWQGFQGGLSGELAANYTLVHMPNNVTVFAPKKAAVHKDFAFYVTYVEKDKRVRVMSVAYGADLNLAYIKWGVYDKVD